MDNETFDRIARRFGMVRTRRSTVAGLGAVGLHSVLGGAGLDVLAKRKKKKKKKCKAERIDQTCAGACGSVKNNCKKLVECGGCGICQRCNAPSSTCEIDNDLVGDTCGSDKVCLANGSCADCGGSGEPCCSGNSCGLGTVCVDGTCEACGFVGAPCCATGSCSPFIGSGCFEGTCELCGAEGEQCCPNEICNNASLNCNGGTCVES